jgi:hypothetical protein
MEMVDQDKTGGGGIPPPCRHQGVAVYIGGHFIYAGGGNYLKPEDMASYKLRVLLRAEQETRNLAFGYFENGFLWLPIPDYQTVHESDWSEWKQALQVVANAVSKGHRVIVFCAGGHGRTGLFLASLLALMEPDIDDPTAELRRRYCHKAVETEKQEAQVKRFLNEIRAARAATTEGI